MSRLTVPTVACIIGEGGSGGAVAIAVADRVLMQENAIYSVITPEGCAAILWRDAGEAKKAAAAFKPDALHCLDLGVIDGVVVEPEGGAQTDHDEAARYLGEALRGDPGRALGDTGRGAAPLAAGQVPGHGRLRLSDGAAGRRAGAALRAFHTIHRVFNGEKYAPRTRRGPRGSGPRAPNPPSGGEARAGCPPAAQNSANIVFNLRACG